MAHLSVCWHNITERVDVQIWKYVNLDVVDHDSFKVVRNLIFRPWATPLVECQCWRRAILSFAGHLLWAIFLLSAMEPFETRISFSIVATCSIMNRSSPHNGLVYYIPWAKQWPLEIFESKILFDVFVEACPSFRCPSCKEQSWRLIQISKDESSYPIKAQEVRTVFQ